MEKTLEENGVSDESEEFYKLSMNDEHFLPAIHLYFNDDLTEAQTTKCSTLIARVVMAFISNHLVMFLILSIVSNINNNNIDLIEKVILICVC